MVRKRTGNNFNQRKQQMSTDKKEWTLLAIDPGSPDLGAALFTGGRLIACAHIEIERAPDRQCPICAAPCRHAAESKTVARLMTALEAWVIRHLGEERPRFVVAEQPQSFIKRKRGPKGDWQFKASRTGSDRSVLLCHAAMVAALDMGRRWGSVGLQYSPATLKGSTPKEVWQAVQTGLMTPEERAIIPRMPRAQRYNSDACDAACIGRVWLARAHQRRWFVSALARDLAK